MDPSAVISLLLVGLARAMILFIVSAGLTFVLGVLRVPNVAHGSLYMIGAFVAFTIATAFGQSSAGFWFALILAPLVVAAVALIIERGLLSHLYQREHLMLILFTFGLMLILNDLVKLIWGAEYRSVTPPEILDGAVTLFGFNIPRYSLFLLFVGP
ncbi:MAG: branched-chain amino acid ABC transporter permease, partial [Chloroflexi bacterium]